LSVNPQNGNFDRFPPFGGEAYGLFDEADPFFGFSRERISHPKPKYRPRFVAG